MIYTILIYELMSNKILVDTFYIMFMWNSYTDVIIVLPSIDLGSY